MNFFHDVKKGIKYIIESQKKIFVNVSIMDNNKMFKDKVVLITGGSDGLGFEMAKRFSSAGAHVVITGRNEEKLKNAVSKLKNTIYFVNDIQIVSQQEELIDFVWKKFHKINVLINNAGISKHEKDFLDVSELDFDEQFNINLKGGYFLTQNVIKRLSSADRKNLTIIFISSERGNQCDFLPYGLTKIAINSLVEGLSCRFIKEGIRINAIAPGVTCSNLIKVNKYDNLASHKYKSGRIFRPEEVAETAFFLASDYAKCISGEIIHTNLGNHLNSYFK